MSLKQLRMMELAARVGDEIGVSPWLAVEQERIDLFARAIDDALRPHDGAEPSYQPIDPHGPFS